nr:FACT complex subunit SSRP1 [Tanacetum cinerariifolium]
MITSMNLTATKGSFNLHGNDSDNICWFGGAYGLFWGRLELWLMSIVVFCNWEMQNVGQLKAHSRGRAWKKQGGGKVVEVDASEILRITWMKVLRSNQLGV